MTDFLIIGGGIAGVSAGARLSALGTVTLLETEPQLGYHASGRSAALFEQEYGLPSTVALSRASAEYHATANGGVLSPRGLMFVAGPDEAEGFAATTARMQIDQISPEEAKALFPILDTNAIAHAAYHAECWDVDTDLLIQNFAREIRANGEIVTGARVTDIRRTGDGWEVEAKGETYAAKVLVNAAGAWVDEVAKLAGIAPLGFTPLRRSIARVPAPDGMDLAAWPMVFGVDAGGHETWYCKPDAGALLISPAEEDPAEPHDAWADDMVLAEGIARFSAATTYEVTRMLANWAGLRTFSPDRNLVIGPSPQDPSFLWFAGQGGYGFQTAPGASALLADLVVGRPPEIDADTRAATDPARFD